ncbi:MAG TPA: hypothetical protein VFT38_02720 [Vicinamibacteria bacterium]|nr:hypothetical protein [Vicinamibacteria bacterium]
MGSEQIRIFVDSWAVAWSALLLLGYVAHLTPWPSLKVLRADSVARTMLALSAAAVLGLTLAGAREPSAILAAWAIITSSVKLLYDSLGELW